MNRFADFADAMNSRFKANVMLEGDSVQSSGIPRFSTGVLSLDCATGGGHCFGKVELLVGAESTGKTTLALKAARSITEYDHAAKVHRDFFDGDFEPCVALYIDVEAAADLKYASLAHGVFFDGPEKNAHLARPETSEQAIDLVTEAILENVFDLIIVDSLAAMTPTAEIEHSSEDWQMGLNARLLNKAFRKWVAGMARLSQQGKIGPCLMCLNQFRDSMALYAKRSIPGGKGQRHASGIILEASPQKYDKGELRDNSIVTLSGAITKNKVSSGVKSEYEFQLCVSEHESVPFGCVVSNAKELQKRGMALELIVRGKPGKNAYTYKDFSASTQDAMMSHILGDESIERTLWRDIVFLETAHDPSVAPWVACGA